MDAILNWMKDFMIIYLILTIFMHLAAAEQYKKYLRFFSGMILLFVLTAPVMRLLGQADKWDAFLSYDAFWEQLERTNQEAQSTDFLENNRYMQMYEEAVAKDIVQQAEDRNIMVRQMKVHLTGDYEINQVTVWLNDSKEQDRLEHKTDLLEFLKQAYGLREDQIVVY